MQGVTYPLAKKPAKTRFWPFGGPLKINDRQAVTALSALAQESRLQAFRRLVPRGGVEEAVGKSGTACQPFNPPFRKDRLKSSLPTKMAAGTA